MAPTRHVHWLVHIRGCHRHGRILAGASGTQHRPSVSTTTDGIMSAIQVRAAGMARMRCLDLVERTAISRSASPTRTGLLRQTVWQTVHVPLMVLCDATKDEAVRSPRGACRPTADRGEALFRGLDTATGVRVRSAE